MAYDNDQNPMELPGNNKRRKSSDHLPKYFRTQVNKKFLASTIDQMIQPGSVEKISGYYGRKDAKGYNLNDFYVGDVSKSREDYQFEPATVIRDELDNVNFYTDYNDYINQLRNLGSNVDDHSLLNREEYYAWNPHINWDKFVNFREYYWLPNGPQTIDVAGQTEEVEQTITVTAQDNIDNYAYVFTPDGLTQNPVLTLYRGITYKFEIDAPGNPLSFRTRKENATQWNSLFSYPVGEKANYQGAIYVCTVAHNASEFNPDFWEIDTEFNLVDQVSAQGVDQGVIELTVDAATPDIIYYMSENDINASGTINVLDISESTSIDVEKEVLGLKNYKTSSGIYLSNGMKIRFVGNVTPERYAEGQWYVEGVGEQIKLIAEVDLNVPSTFTNDIEVTFDNDDFGFDRLPFSEAVGYPVAKDYITISRESQDGNLWTKYNRWFHKDVIEASAVANGQLSDIDQSARATRPIVEFNPNLKLFNFGTTLKKSIDLVDNFTKDIFSTIEGSNGYNVDGVDLSNGMRVLFTADNDPLVTGRIFEVKFLDFNNSRQITLVETDDAEPLENEVLLCNQGESFRGKMLWFNGDSWNVTQSKTGVNQSPLFDMFDEHGHGYGDSEYFESSDFTGTKIFSYKLGTGSNDSELGFPLTYRSIENIGDIVFEFNLVNDLVTYAHINETPTTTTLASGYLRKYSDRTSFTLCNGWKKGKELSSQSVIRQYFVDNTRTFYTIDMYKQSSLLEDLWIRVYVNNSLKFEGIDYSIGSDANNNATVVFNRDLDYGDNVVIKTRSAAEKTEFGKYEITSNLERNPLNKDINEFTLGEVNDHVGTIVEELSEFSGIYPGISNLRDLQNITQYGKRIVKHSAPANLPLYHIVDKDANAVKAIRYARREYGKFKRSFLQQAERIGFSGPIKDHVDLILNELTKDKVNSMPFYFSDMVPFKGSVKQSIEVSDVDNQFFALTKIFTLESPSDVAVEIYQNGIQLLHNKDYTFNSQGFAIITTEKQIGDIIDIYEYESTNGSYIPPTPTKLGLYPKYEPAIFVDDTYLEPQTVIQGHDGSITIAFGDFRDDLLLELEKRIYNNLKVEYDSTMFDIYDFIPGHTRNTDISEHQINDAMISDFVQWLQLVDSDYTLNSSFERTESFTFNHTGMTDVDDHNVHGWWRAVYKYAYDTDRPHSHPWEMLGFTIKPSWWDEQYGEAPYTSNNFLMWEDIELGLIREPNAPARVDPKFARPGLTAHIPSDEDGNLLSPVMSSFVKQFDSTQLDNNFVYGDHSPVETAWRRSGEFPFALLTSLMLVQPSRVFATCFDRIRQVRSQVGDIVYKNENEHLILSNIDFPNTSEGLPGERTYTSGIINYVFDYLASSVLTTYEEYKADIRAIDNQLGFKIGGFTSKDKFKLILDSRTPTNKGNVFVPEENYKLFLNTSTPVRTINYSGVIIEKQSYGFVVKGYNREQPYFNYNPAISLQNDPLERIGGITASFLLWDEGKSYSQGAVVEYQNSFYRVVESHTSSTEFDDTKFARVPKLPEEGGREIYMRKAFKNNVERMPYGKVFETIQEVVDFLLGYGHYLETQGFVFDYYDADEQFVSNWQTSSREFAFWTTQNWSAGAVITLSPGAFQIKFKSDYAIVDDIYDTFYGYSLIKADGKKLNKENASLTRENPGEFVIRPKATEDGIFGIRLSLIQKEHAVVIDNKTVFGDIIYDQEPGYRQERIKVLGYRSGDWDGSLNVPGFIFDNAKVTEWKSWQDYAIGDLVKYKEYYYAARYKVSGKEVFESSDWVRLEEKPSMELIPNWDYKVNQFADFYDLDTDNFDIEQQKFAQHLIGYQNREYLANIINDDVSQYKFYQGFIQDKGTENALTKLFDVLGSADKDSLEFYEEWAIKQGQYGASEGFDEVEFILDESKFKLQPQSVELVERISDEETDLVYRIRPFETYLTPSNYDHKPFPTKVVNETYTRNSGYVNPDDVDFVVNDYDSIANIGYNQIQNENLVWAGNVGLDWNVYAYLATDLVIDSVDEEGGTNISLTSIPKNIAVGDIIGVGFYNVDDEITVGEFVKVSKILNNVITVTGASFSAAENVSKSLITTFVSVRTNTFTDANKLVQEYKSGITRIWIDEDSNKNWQVINKENEFSTHQVIVNTETASDQNYGSSIAANRNNTLLAVGAPDNGDGKVFVYVRAGNSGSFQLNQIIDADDTICNELQRFGAAVDVSEDGKFLVVGSPNASNIKTLYTGDWIDTKDYNQLDIVRYQDTLWQADTDIEGAEDAIQFSSFDSVAQINDDLGLVLPTSEKINTLLTGNYPFKNLNTNHFIVKAPFDMYEGSAPGFDVEFVWNTITAANQEISVEQENFEVGEVLDNWITRTNYEARQPFSGTVPDIDNVFVTNTHTIQLKIDTILYVENSNTIPLVGQIVETQTGFGTVAYRYNEGAEVTLYINQVNGEFGTQGSLTTRIGEFVGEYSTVAPVAETARAEEKWGGYWVFLYEGNTDLETLDNTYAVGNTNADTAKGLIIANVTPQGEIVSEKIYENVLNYRPANTNNKSLNILNSQITSLTYFGNPGAPIDDTLAGAEGETREYRSSLVVVRVPSTVSDNKSAGDTISLYVNEMENFNTGIVNELSYIGVTPLEINKPHVIEDMWDGYIDILITQNLNGRLVEPKIGQIVKDITNLGEAEVVYYQRFNGSQARIYVKDIVGNWALGKDFAEEREIAFLSDGGSDPFYNPISGSRVIGDIQRRSFEDSDINVGKLFVFDINREIEWQGNVADLDDRHDTLYDAEYWLYEEDNQVSGIARLPNIPASNNNDWNVVYNISAAASGYELDTPLVNEGLYSVYERRGIGQFTKINSYIVPDRYQDSKLGTDIKLAKIGDLYRLFVKTANSSENQGRLYIINDGEQAGQQYGWEIARNKNYKGVFDEARTYFENDIVIFEGSMYRAFTTTTGTFDTRVWLELDEITDYLGYLPNITGTYIGDSTSVIDDPSELVQFAKDFDTSRNGEVLVVSTEYAQGFANTLEIYRNTNGSFYRSQSIDAPDKTSSYGNAIAMSNDGKLIAVGAPGDDVEGLNHGKVYVYKQVNGEFELSQELYSPSKERLELFGWTVDFDGNRLVVGSRNGDSAIETTFDNSTTLFDNDFLRFKKESKDTGVLRVYERIDDTLGYAATLDFDVEVSPRYFGRSVKLSNNHVYVGLPYWKGNGREGTVVDYRIQDNTTIWNVLRKSKDTVDVSKIKRVMLYNTATSEIVTYLDYIDVLQGKIAGPAEQELTYKTYYDPATYTTGTLSNTNSTNSWGEDQVGQLWWDLTDAKFRNPYQGNVIFSSNTWNTPFSNANTIDIFEWVESEYLPSEWDELSGTDKGLRKGITGTSKHGDDAYVVKRKYSVQTGTFKNYFYYWVGQKTTIPQVEGRLLSAFSVSQLIRNPANVGYKFISFIGDNQFALHNCESLITNNDIALSVQYWTIDNQDINIHNQYQILTEGLESSKPNRDIERKWVDSLVGFDDKNRQVPAPELSPKEKYGILNKPRQGWFVNQYEALKQFIERSNTALSQSLIADDKDITPLTSIDPAPTEASRRWDRSVNTITELQFVGVAKARRAILQAQVLDGKLLAVDIIDGGRGYLQAPTVTVLGQGSNAELETEINSRGEVIAVNILNEGINYEESNTSIVVRRYSVLVESDDTVNGNWALYERDVDLKEWILVQSQAYNVSKYWEYIDWYADGYNSFTQINFVINFPYDLPSINDSIGDIIKIQNVGTGGWLLLEKIDAQTGVDYSVNYKTIGRQNGTIKIKSNLYNIDESLTGYSTTSYDVLTFDGVPTTESRIIIETLRDNVFIDDLALVWNELFFASLRYVFAEQNYVDWAFKTSFIKAQHNVGELEQKVNFQNDNLENYENYIEEVKPYKTKVREYLSSYETLDNSRSVTTDFDLPARFDPVADTILPLRVKTSSTGIVVDNIEEVNVYPNKNWLDNAGFKVKEIKLAEAGEGYKVAPQIRLEGGSGTGATAIATLGRNGSLSAIIVTNEGDGYLEAPAVVIDGAIAEDGTQARAVAIIEETPVRRLQTVIKFDRVSGTYEFVNLDTAETFLASGTKLKYQLKWPMDLRSNRVVVFQDDNEVLARRYEYKNVLDTSKGYDRYYGEIEFFEPLNTGVEIRVEYFKSINLLNAQDRINLAYEPSGDNFGKTLGQLMDGVDYGGVEVRSFDFGGTTGWNTAAWMTQGWDVFDTTFEDEIFRMDGSTEVIELSKPLEDGVEYNLYRMSYDINGQLLNNQRLDDPNYGTEEQTNKDALMLPIVGDGETTTIFLSRYDINTLPEDSTEQAITIIVRKNTSDGSFLADPESYDTAISGGDLAYSTATGLNSADISIDGDGFVTPTTSSGPEEIVPGQVLDTLDIQVFEKPTGGASQVTSRNFIGDGVQTTFKLGKEPGSFNNLFVKVDYNIKTTDDYTIDFVRQEIVFNEAPANNAKISVVDLGVSATTILEIDSFVGNGTATEFLTNARWEDNANSYVTVDGVQIDVSLIQSDDTYEIEGNFVIKFPTPPANGASIKIMLAVGGIEVFQQYSTVTIDELVADGSTVAFDLSQAPFELQPESAYTIVKVNDTILNPGYSQSFEVTTKKREYQLDLTQIPVASVNSYDLAVYLNGIELEFLQTWTFEGAGSFDSTVDPQYQPGSAITLTAGIGEDGDELKVYVLTDGDYRMGYYESGNEYVKTPGTLHLDTPYSENDKITVYQFSNHNSQGIERQSFEVTERTETTEGTDLYYSFALLRKGYITLRKPARAAEYVWVVKNGTLLSPNVDYSVTSNKMYVKLVEEPNEGDKLQVIHFADQIVADKFGWRQFKDMLNRTHYKRLEELYHLAEPLNWYDDKIVVVDAEGLSNPSDNPKYPGVIFIEGERIEFFRRNGNELLQIRRGTLGTGIKDVYEAGTMLMEQGVDATLPYKDENDVVTAVAGGYSQGSEEYENSDGMNVTSITYNFNNNTAFPVRVPGVYEQVCTVIGEGFTDRVKVFVGETECETRFVSSTEINFDVPGFNVPGAFDLIVVNPFTTVPIDTPQTSFVVPGGIKYVQILLPFAPIPNPTSATDWYKDTIPEEYWEAQDIEVFVAGRRLRKTPINVYNYDDQDSPEGDIQIEAEYAVNKNIGAYVRLTTPPPEGTTVNIIRKIGTTWSNTGEALSQSDSNVAKFLRAKTTELPR